MKNIIKYGIMIISFLLTTNLYSSNGVPKLKSENYTGIFVGYDGIIVTKIDPVTKEYLDSWSTISIVAYSMDLEKTNFRYEEFNEKGDVTNTKIYRILKTTEDEITITLVTVDNNSMVFEIVFWKDKSMMAFISDNEIYLASGVYIFDKFGKKVKIK